MNCVIEGIVHDATSSWYGFESQGRLGILYFLKKLNSINYNEWDKWVLEFEYMEDFAIGVIDELGNMKYHDICQVKARKDMSKDDIKKVYGELGFKQSILGEHVNVQLITRCSVDKYIDITETISNYIDTQIEELKKLKEYKDLDRIKDNLKIKNSKSELKSIRKICRKEFKELKDIKNITQITEFCNNKITEFSRYKSNLEVLKINVIEEDFDNINNLICENVREILTKLEKDKFYKLEADYIDKVKNAILYFISYKLEDYILKNDKMNFTINAKEIINVILEDKSKITELHYLYEIREEIYLELKKYCKYCKGHVCNEPCELRDIIEAVRCLSVNQFKSLMLNSNPHLSRDINFSTGTSILGDSKLEDFLFDEIKDKNYCVNIKSLHTYINLNKEKFMLSFINLSNKRNLKRKLDENASQNIHIYNDNEIIINENLDFTYTIGITHSINQHWDEEYLEKEKNKILSSCVEFKSIKNL